MSAINAFTNAYRHGKQKITNSLSSTHSNTQISPVKVSSSAQAPTSVQSARSNPQSQPTQPSVKPHSDGVERFHSSRIGRISSDVWHDHVTISSSPKFEHSGRAMVDVQTKPDAKTDALIEDVKQFKDSFNNIVNDQGMLSRADLDNAVKLFSKITKDPTNDLSMLFDLANLDKSKLTEEGLNRHIESCLVACKKSGYDPLSPSAIKALGKKICKALPESKCKKLTPYYERLTDLKIAGIGADDLPNILKETVKHGIFVNEELRKHAAQYFGSDDGSKLEKFKARVGFIDKNGYFEGNTKSSERLDLKVLLTAIEHAVDEQKNRNKYKNA